MTVLRPDEAVPESVALPRVIGTMRRTEYYCTDVHVADGGIWQVDDRALHSQRPSANPLALAIHEGSAKYAGRRKPRFL